MEQKRWAPQTVVHVCHLWKKETQTVVWVWILQGTFKARWLRGESCIEQKQLCSVPPLCMDTDWSCPGRECPRLHCHRSCNAKAPQSEIIGWGRISQRMIRELYSHSCHTLHKCMSSSDPYSPWLLWEHSTYYKVLACVCK